MAAFVRTPEVVDARQVNLINRDELARWVGPDYRGLQTSLISNEAALTIRTVEGVAMARPSDWIVRDAQGRFDVIANDAFTRRFEPA